MTYFYYELIETDSKETKGFMLRQVRLRFDSKEELMAARENFLPYFAAFPYIENIVTYEAGSVNASKEALDDTSGK